MDSYLRRVLRIALTGVVCVLAVLAAGRITERLLLGANDAAIRTRVDRDVRGAFDVMSRGLQDVARQLADPDTLQAASRDDENAARRLFDIAQAATVSHSADVELAVTAYGPGSRPLAWAGRPSELPKDRLEGDEAWFIAQGALGLRLVYAMPVTDAAGNRIGTIASEQSIRRPTSTGAVTRVDDFQFPGELIPVSLELAFEDIRTTPDPDRIDVTGPNGRHLVTAVITPSDLVEARAQWRRMSSSIAEMTAAVFVLLLCGPLLDWRDARDRAYESRIPNLESRYVVAFLAIAGAIIASRLLFRLASPADWSDAEIFSAAAYASPLLRPFLASPFDFLLTAATAAGLMALVFFAFEAWRMRRRRARIPVDSLGTSLLFLVTQLLAGTLAVGVLRAQHALLADTVANTTLDLLHFSLHPWNTALTALQFAIVIWDATAIAVLVLIFRAAYLPWRISRTHWRVRLATATCWVLPGLIALSPQSVTGPLLLALFLAASVALIATRLKGRYRQGSQAFRLTLLWIGLVLPALAFYADVFALANRAKTELVETRYGPQALNQRRTIQSLMQQSLQQIDMFPGLADLVSVPPGPSGSEALTDRAFQVWRITGLAMYPVTSSVELFGPDGRLVSRFAFSLPDDLNALPTSEETDCSWEVFEEVSPFFAVERRVLSAGRAVCVNDPNGGSHVVGSVRVHAMLDYANLPFIASKSPYVELLRPVEPQRSEGVSGGDIEFAVYGWSRMPLYASAATAWRLDEATFAKLASSRTPVWARLDSEDQRYDVYLLSDRGGIYGLGFPVVTLLGHMMNLAELTVIASVTFLAALLLAALFSTVARRTTSARKLLREVRASFYRKLFLAFSAATVVPVVALAVVTSNYVADQLRANVEQEAVRTASAAQRVVEDLVAPRAAQQGVAIDDNLMVWVSRLIGQDVNIFSGPRLLATSERNLFASGVIPVRTPSDVYVALQLQNEAATVTSEQVGTAQPFLVAGTHMSVPQMNALLTVPLASRAQEIERQIDTLDRRVLLAALLFILAGAGIGYSMAERIADPVNRLTRATRRIASGQLDTRLAATSSDELGRLVDDFNHMAHDLEQQRTELERTNRLEAWAEMARQVAHEIKNPLTPIQLNAEHLRRVNTDRGAPLTPVLDQAVNTILAQVKLLRQIASEFSSFASSPLVHRTPVDTAELLREIVDPYRSALAGQIHFTVDVTSDLPPVYIDRTLVTRSLTNIIENALHAMGAHGALTIVASRDDDDVRIRVSDTGGGMDPDALARAFEPYFSTKASGTGLGLPIAKRNVELSGGTITIDSERGRGTTVELTLPVAVQHEAA
ncbi:MAG TPA: HAMP domain-containing sensor histidine kinase [Vicinamibacterales bacterium]|nr:HAMP domain-containing sensor histidine kinase [Vicinamibacterales bacterium]